MASSIVIRSVRETDREWIAEAMTDAWGSDRVVSRGRLTENASLLPGFVAERCGRPVGIALIRLEREELEVVVLMSLVRFEGVGSALLRAVEDESDRLGVRRAWLVTTNDNLDAIRFYQRRGWQPVALHRDAVTEARRLKPEISEHGAYGIPIRHELEFEAPKPPRERG